MIDVAVQRESGCSDLPTDEKVTGWAVAAVAADVKADAVVTVRMVDREEGAELNTRYRGLTEPTNVLSFPFDASEFLDFTVLGDIVICAPVVFKEARAQGKTTEQHWAHMVVHGCLHLLGYDHQTDSQAENMEGLEAEILTGLGYPDPYLCGS